jgi:hypothetical protein
MLEIVDEKDEKILDKITIFKGEQPWYAIYDGNKVRICAFIVYSPQINENFIRVGLTIHKEIDGKLFHNRIELKTKSIEIYGGKPW